MISILTCGILRFLNRPLPNCKPAYGIKVILLLLEAVHHRLLVGAVVRLYRLQCVVLLAPYLRLPDLRIVVDTHW